MQNKLYRTATPKACSESAPLAGGAEPQLLARLAGPPERPGHRRGLEPWPRTKPQPRAALPRLKSSGRLRSCPEHEDLDGVEEVLGLKRRGRARARQNSMFSCSITIVDIFVMSDSVQPAQEGANKRGVRMQGEEGVRAGREAYARFHPAGKPGSKKRRRGTCAPSCARGSHEAVARDCRGRTYPSLVPLRFAGVSVRTEAEFGRPPCLTGSIATKG